MRVLLVEATMDELLELERDVVDLADGLEIDVALGTRGALAVLGAAPFDVVVSCLADGELLEEARRRHPEVARFALSAETDDAAVLWLLRDAHQVLRKPCRPAVLVGALRRLEVAIAGVSEDERAANGAVSSFAAAGGPLAALLRDRAGADVASVTELVGSDPGLAAKVLQIASSELFGRGCPVVDLPTAVQRIGLDALRSAMVCGLFTSTHKPERVSLAVANVAASLVPQRLRDEAFAAALLSDVDAHLLALWGLPSSIVAAAAAQQVSASWPRPSRDGGLSAVLQVAREQVAAVANGTLRVVARAA